ncbi:hypothetical protein [Aliiroseovarius crassostreae]|uniref:hypothetical protein n=1 Tax=Aliiroseovarius crassostreae TaxID=154981 RepID=UPI0021FE37E3|nr:hypothetical protein [Aliiroseovarius crassostreae]UWQ06937.1 hypothetical protein K3X25_08945 [Aliiroseovarius crassostreae]
MSKEKGIILAAVQIALFALFSGVLLAKGGLFVGQHEGDTLHLLQILTRMSAGQVPHLDFVTPIGAMAFLPIVLFSKMGIGFGHSFLYGQVLVGAAFLPAIWWVSMTRLAGIWRHVFAIAMIVLCLGLIHGEADQLLSVSMHYNRWAWVAAFVAILTALLPSRFADSPVLDGILIGAAFVVMAMIKVTYFAAFFPPVLVALLTRGAGRTVLWALVMGLVGVGLITLYAGTPVYWLLYLADLLNVAGSEFRSSPGLPLGKVISAPAYLPGTALALVAVILLRQAGRMREGLVLLLLLPGFVYVTYQNYGNDPQWIGLVGLLLISLLPARPVTNGLGWDLGRGMVIAASCAFVLATPSFLNIAQSPFRHLMTDVEDFVPFLPDVAQSEDLQARRVRANLINVSRPFDGPDTIFAASYLAKDREDEKLEFRGEEFPSCVLESGMMAWFRGVADDLNAAGLVQGKSIFVADILASYWLFGAGEPLQRGAPWYYGGLTGIENADLLLVPSCPQSGELRKLVLEEISETEWVQDVTELRRTGDYVLYQLPDLKS